jgi:hypothetical protein
MLASQLLFPNRKCSLQQRMVGGEIALPTANPEPDVKVVPSSGSSVYGQV